MIAKSEALLATGTNEQINGACGQRRVIDLAQEPIEFFGVDHTVLICMPCRPQDAVVRGIVDNNAQMHTRTCLCQSLASLDCGYETCTQAVTPPDDIHAYALFDAALRFGKQKSAN